MILISLLVSIGSVAVMWVYMCRVSAERNGWHVLAEQYRLSGPLKGTQFGFQSAIFNGFAFTGTLNLGVAKEGLFLRGGLPLRLFHPALIVPWSEISADKIDRAHSSGALLRFDRFPDMGIEVSDKTLGRLAEAVPSDWGVTIPWQNLQ